MSDVDKRLAAFRAATEGVRAPEGFRQRVLSRVRAAAVLPLAAAVGWYGGIGIKTLVAAAVIASGTAAYQLTVADPVPVAVPEGVAKKAAVREASTAAQVAWPAPKAGEAVVAAKAGEKPVNPFAVLLRPRDGGRAEVGDSGAVASTAVTVGAAAGASCGKALVLNPHESSPRLELIFSRERPTFEADLARAESKLPPGGSVYYGWLQEAEGIDSVSTARLHIFSGNAFIATGSPGNPLFIVVSGSEPSVMTFDTTSGGGRFFVGKVALPKLKRENTARLLAYVELEGPSEKITVTVRFPACGGLEAEQLKESPGSRYFAFNLPLVPAVLTASAPGYAPKSIELKPEAGKRLEPSLELERDIPIKAEVIVGTFAQLRVGSAAVQEVRASQVWLPMRSCPITVGQENRRYNFGPAVLGRALGQATISVFQSSVSPGEVSALTDLMPNTVYLLKCPEPDQWVLARFTR